MKVLPILFEPIEYFLCLFYKKVVNKFLFYSQMKEKREAPQKYYNLFVKTRQGFLKRIDIHLNFIRNEKDLFTIPLIKIVKNNMEKEIYSLFAVAK